MFIIIDKNLKFDSIDYIYISKTIKKMNTRKDIQLGLCCLNCCLRCQKPPIFCSRGIILRTIEMKGIEELKRRAIENLKDLKTMIKWNYENNIHVYRLSS